MKFLLIFFLFVNICFSENFKIYGNTNYFQKENKNFITTVNLEYKIKIFEPNHKKYIIHFGGTINPDYDHFGKTMKINGFTGFGIDF
jgi:hypothetical protein